MLLLIGCLGGAVAHAASAADEAYAEARDALHKQRKDASRRKLKHHWVTVAKKLDAVAARWPSSDRAPEAIFLRAETYNELYRFSGQDDDLTQAERSYRKLIDGWPKHRLADDAALSWARLLLDRRQDIAGARRVAKAGLEHAQDKKRALSDVLASLPKEVAPKPKPAPAKVATSVSKATPAPARSKNAKTLSDAIARLARSVKPLETPVDSAIGEPPPLVQARRMPSFRPRAPIELPEEPEPSSSTEEVHEEGDRPLVADLAERLRDVRVGDAPGAKARANLRQTALEQATVELSLAQQLGLKFKRVIIDAGHGGHDTGAIGPKGTREKDVSLAIAKKLAALLEAQGLEVVLTRDDDTFVALEERTRIANRQRGDLFISVHCNAAPNKKTRGIETYTLNTSSNRYSIRLAARENATTERGVGDLQLILADLATKANTGESSQLAELVQRSLVTNLSRSFPGVRNLGTKEALFFVLLGAKMPAILVETSFISHPEEEKHLASDAYQTEVASGIAEAVQSFLQARLQVAHID